MTNDKIIQHPSSLMATGRKALREGEFDALATTLRNLTPPDSAIHLAMSSILARHEDIDEEEKIARVASVLIKVHETEGWEATVSHATRLADQFPALFSTSVLNEIKRRKEAESSS